MSSPPGPRERRRRGSGIAYAIRRVLSATALAALSAACQPAAPPEGEVLVVASVYPLYDFASRVAGDRARVVPLVPTGVEPHDWEPSPQSVVEVRRARLFVYNGAGFDPWVSRLTGEVKGGKTRIVKTTDGIELLSNGGAVDPHVWLDPVLAQAQVGAIRAALQEVDPTNAAAYADRATAYTSRLARLDEAFASGLRTCARREIVTSHAAFSYLARRYRLVQTPVMGLAPEAEPSPADLAAIATAARAHKATSIFVETLVSSRLADALAREIGARTLVLNPIEGLTRDEAAAGKDYVTLMEANLASLRTGLGCT